MSWEDAVAFCEWLTELDQRRGKLGKGEHYRLPSDHEWSYAVGIGKEKDAETIPSAKNRVIADVFPWGGKFPPPKGAGNYYGEETTRNPYADREPIAGYDDGFERTAPVGSFEANQYGLYDMGGNVREWCEDWYSAAQEKRLLRGGSWFSAVESFLLSSRRDVGHPSDRDVHFGFRVVIASVNAAASTPTSAPEPPFASGNTAMAIQSATKDKPFENSLGMKFVPVPITGGPSDGQTVLFSIWETRVGDYERFLRDDRKRPWNRAGFLEDDHPVVSVSWEDAVAFCEWLTERDQKKGKLGKDERYRLPTDHEWSCAVGLGREEDAEVTPKAKSREIADIYPWGEKWPPPNGAGNYYGKEMKRNPIEGRSVELIEGYDDGFDRVAPVGSYSPNALGLYDLGGNAWEWCESRYSTAEENRVMRGGSWYDNSRDILLSSFRNGGAAPDKRFWTFGFRCVLATGGG